jgi:hypothetical protein
MKKQIVFWVVPILAALWVAPVHSEEIVLTPALVERVIRDFPGYIDRVQAYTDIDPSNPAGYVNAQVTAREVVDYLEGRGWELEEFAAATSAVMHAYAALMMGEISRENSGEMARHMQEMEETLRDPSVPAETKAAIRQSMEGMAEAQETMRQSAAQDVPPENLAVVAPYAPQIGALLEAVGN